MEAKATLRERFRQERREHVAAQPEQIKALLFHRPPAALGALVPADAVIGLYAAANAEAPTAGYARYFHEHGHTLALPRFSDGDAAMHFAEFADPYDEDALVEGPFGIRQPATEMRELVPVVVFVPLVAFTSKGERLGQGGGHYDRWLDAHPGVLSIGLAWDMQEAETLPVEAHDRALGAIVTPTRMHGPFGGDTA